MENTTVQFEQQERICYPHKNVEEYLVSEKKRAESIFKIQENIARKKKRKEKKLSEKRQNYKRKFLEQKLKITRKDILEKLKDSYTLLTDREDKNKILDRMEVLLPNSISELCEYAIQHEEYKVICTEIIQRNIYNINPLCNIINSMNDLKIEHQQKKEYTISVLSHFIETNQKAYQYCDRELLEESMINFSSDYLSEILDTTQDEYFKDMIRKSICIQNERRDVSYELASKSLGTLCKMYRSDMNKTDIADEVNNRLLGQGIHYHAIEEEQKIKRYKNKYKIKKREGLYD